MRTFQTRLHLTEEEAALLDRYAAVFANVEHTLFVDLQKGETSLNQLKASDLKCFGITARQFNSARSSIEGKIQSLKEIQKQRITDHKDLIEKWKKRLKSKRPCNRHLLHQNTREISAASERPDRRQGADVFRLSKAISRAISP